MKFKKIILLIILIILVGLLIFFLNLLIKSSSYNIPSLLFCNNTGGSCRECYKIHKKWECHKVSKVSENRIIKNISECGNKSLRLSVKCMVDYVNQFYYYNKSLMNFSGKLKFEKLKTEGGVCRHYAYYYEKWGREMGFGVKEIYIKGINHRASIIYDKDKKDYCFIEPTSYNKSKFFCK